MRGRPQPYTTSSSGASIPCGGWGVPPSSFYISPRASSILLLQSPVRITFSLRPRRCRKFWLRTRSRCAETLSSMSLHVSSKIQAFFLASHVFVFGIDFRKAANITPSLVEVVRSLRRGRVHRPSYSMCSLRGALKRHHRTR